MGLRELMRVYRRFVELLVVGLVVGGYGKCVMEFIGLFLVFFFRRVWRFWNVWRMGDRGLVLC